jgi:pimeloyl-ACP methyl ester carboxylesterase
MKKVHSQDGTAIAFDQLGQGPAIILVGGAFTDRSQPTLVQLAALLAPHFTVFNYDRRGRGESGDTAPYAVEREVEDLAALIVDDSRPPLPRDFATQLTELVSSGRRGDAAELFMTKAAEVPAAVVAQMRHAPFWPGVEAVAHTLIYDTTIMGNNNALPTERIASVGVPTLVIDGGASPAWMRNAAQAVADALPNAQRRTLEGQTHDVAPDALAPVLEEFFAGRLTTR